ncbi:MAG TPA: sigma 54-interacting transcriptional regulator, partial [Blastocatellia bacterium]|nr:sigma 54-interacting transcriptional regulator [Blastocatellia bacterium]
RSGEYRWFLVLFNPLKDEQGQLVRWYATATDIEDRKQAEQALQRSDAYLSEAQRLSHTGSFGWDFSSGDIYWSEETFRIFEVEPKAKVTIELILQQTHPEDRASVQQLIERVSRERTKFDVEHRLLLPNGSVKYLHVVGHPSTDSWGRFEFVGAVTDITGRKQAEAALLRSTEQLTIQKAQLDELFEQAPEGVVLLDVEDRVVRINSEFTRIFGYTPEEALGRAINELIAPEELRSEAEEYTQRIIHGKPVNAETIRRRKDGTRIHVSLLAVPISVPGGGQIAEYAIYRDISERRSAELALRRNQAYLAEAQKLSHTGSFAHDPIHGEITYWSEEAYRTFGLDPASGPITYKEARSRIHPDDLEKFEEARERGIREKTGASVDFRVVIPDGSIKYIHCVSRPFVDASGAVVELVGTNMDVTEQHLARASLEKALEEIKQLKEELYRENLALKEEIDKTSLFEEIVGSSEPLRRVLVQITKVAPTDSTVLITGETGTGKELIARAIHKRSARASRAFVTVNCAAVPAALIGSELFGHERGAFTGATQRRLGRFELAEGGTLFLDEVGDLPAETQIALLRVLQERQFERIGGNQPITVNVRIIAATNRDLTAVINAGSFRQDLFYRLNVFPIDVPPLRERKEDIPLLVQYLTERYASKAGKKIKNIEKRTLEMFREYQWPGNVRELQNVIERAVILCDGETLSVDEERLQGEPRRLGETSNGLARMGADKERAIIESALRESRGRVAGPSGAAARLGIPRSTLETKIRSLGIDKHLFKSHQVS